MAKRIFIDTSAFLALEDKSDKWHLAALKFQSDILLKEDFEIITTSYILDETLTLIRLRLGIKQSIQFLRRIRSSKIVKIVHVSKEIEEKASKLFEKYDDKDFSFTDCVSFVVMKDMGLTEAFAFDHHFEQIGFVRKP